MLLRRLCECEQVAARKEEYLEMRKEEGVGGGYRTGDTKDLAWSDSTFLNGTPVPHGPPAPWCAL